MAVQRAGWCPLYWWNQANLTSSSFTLSHARCSGQAVLGFVSVAAAFPADLGDGLSFLLNEFKSGWHAVKLKSNIQILCWAEAHPKNVCGLVCAFPLYLHPRKWVLKCKNLVLLIILLLKSHSCCFSPPSLSGENFLLQWGWPFFVPVLYINFVWTNNRKTVSPVSAL